MFVLPTVPSAQFAFTGMASFRSSESAFAHLGMWAMTAREGKASSAKAKAKVCVVGAGIVGLTAASRLVDEGFAVSIIARETIFGALDKEAAPSTYTSSGSGGLWWPFHIYSKDGLVGAWSEETYRTLESHSRIQDAGVSLVDGFLLHATRTPDLPPFSDLANVQIVSPTTDVRVPSRYHSAFRFTAPVVHAEVYLQWLHNKICGDSEDEVRVFTDLPGWDFDTVSDFARMRIGAEIIVNCTGIGAREFAKDEDLSPGRGVLLYGKRSEAQSEFSDYFLTEVEEEGNNFETTGGFLAYAFPRGNDRVTMGGSIDESGLDTRLGVDDSEIDGVRARVGRVVPCLQNVEEDSRWAGLRPLRSSGVRCETDPEDSKLIHSYGHGGGGFTTAVCIFTFAFLYLLPRTDYSISIYIASGIRASFLRGLQSLHTRTSCCFPAPLTT